MSSHLISWNKVITTAMRMPMVKVNREEFLRSAFSGYAHGEMVKVDPRKRFSQEILDRVAKATINGHLIKVTALSAAAGIPGGFALLGTLPADTAQYYWHVLTLAQELGYIYGWPDMLDGQGNMTQETKNILTIFVGVMMGAQAANKAIAKIAADIAQEAATRIASQALTKTTYYPIVREVAKWIGAKLTKESFAKSASKAVPILGAVVSGSLTAVSYRTMALRLMEELKQENNY